MGKIESFINYVIVKIESKKGHNELVEEILRRIEENYLYIKLEKYKWKVIGIDFLEVVIKLEEIKIEEVKVKVCWIGQSLN